MAPSTESLPTLDIDPELLRHVGAAIDDVRAGKMVILVDDEDRENEGDIVFAAEKVTPELINFMAKHARGLICVTLTEEQIGRLELPMMTLPEWRGGPPLGTAFTVSIEASQGVTTGISAADRARTIAVAANPDSTPNDIVTPGHVFPLKAREGGVLVRTGQTEGSVDLARLAGLTPSGVICEIMNDDGTMARMPDLEKFAREHSMRILTVADLIRYRLQTERLVHRTCETTLTLDQTGTEWKAITYQSSVDGQDILAMVKGTPSEQPTLVRVHRGSTLGDVFCSGAEVEGGHNLQKAVAQIEAAGSGVIVYIPSRSTLRTQLEGLTEDRPSGPCSTQAAQVAEPQPSSLRRFGLGAQVLRELGLRKIRLLTNNPRKIVGIGGYDLEVVQEVPLGE